MSLGVYLGLTLLGPSAFAKGPSQAVIDGPGLASPVPLRERGERTIGPVLSTMVEASGFLSGLFGTDDMLARRPDGELGPRYRVTYTLAGRGRPSIVTQDVFPFAVGGPVTYMPPDQPFWRTDATGGGWFAAGWELSRVLNNLDVEPRSAARPDHSPDVETQHGAPRTLTFAVALAAFAATSFLLWAQRARTRQRP